VTVSRSPAWHSRPVPKPAPVLSAPPVRPPSHRAAARADVRAQIRTAAAECFRCIGVADTRMEDVAEAVGIARPNLYRYFPNKESLVLEVLLEEVRAIHRRRRERLTLKGPVAPLLVEAVVLGFEEAHNNEMFALLMAGDTVDFTDLFSGSTDTFHAVESEFWAPIFDHGRSRGELREGLTNAEMVRWVSFASFLFVGRDEFRRAPDAVRYYTERFVVPALLRSR
jgi:AcrR family transcriptional regulator